MNLSKMLLALAVSSFVCMSQANAAILLSDDFDGTAGSALDAAKWLSFGAEKDGASNARLDVGFDEFSSQNSYTYENLEFSVKNYTNATGFWGYDSGATNHVLIRPDAANALKIQVVASHSGFQITEVALPTVSDMLVNIEWSSTQLRVLIDGVEKVNLTDTTKIPQIAMKFFARKTSAAPSEVSFGHVQVGTEIPEPGTLGLSLMGAMLLFRRKKA